jgi:cytochrome c5
MKKNILILLMPLLFVFACDSQQNPAPINNTESVASNTDQTETVVAKVPIVATDTAPATLSTTETAKTPAINSAKTEESLALSGEQVYTKFCINCHKSGVANAPKLGDTKDWGTRLAKGKDTLYQSAKLGVPGTAMMARGTCSSCSDKELEATVDFMVSKSK